MYFSKLGDRVKAAAESGVPMLFAGNAMELLGKSITDDAGKVYEGLGLAGLHCRPEQKAVRGGRLRPHGPL